MRYTALAVILTIVILLASTATITAPEVPDDAPEPEGLTSVSGKGGALPAGGVPSGYSLSSFTGYFTPNMGQWADSSLLFTLAGSGVWLLDDGIRIDIGENYVDGEESPREVGYGETRDFPIGEQMRRGVCVGLDFIGCNEVEPEGVDALPHRSNYILGGDASEWRTDVPNFGEVWYRGLWDGIDLRYYIDGDGLKYDFVVRPGGDPGDIRIAVGGAEDMGVDDGGDLVIRTARGDIIDRGLYIFQGAEGAREQIEGSFQLHRGSEYGFTIEEEYDHRLPLVIDPKLQWSTFVGGTGDETFVSADTSPSGDVFVSGQATTAFPTTVGAYDQTFNGMQDAFICRLSSDGTSMLYATYVGGDETDRTLGVAVDDSGYLYAAGLTASTNFPTTPGAFQMTITGGLNGADMFILKLNPAGSSLQYSTLLGGLYFEWVEDICIDPSGNAYVTGDTASVGYNTTSGAYDETHNDVIHLRGDIFVTKLNPTGSGLVYSTFVGGDGFDYGKSICVDGSGNAIVTGSTQCDDFPNTTGAFDNTLGGFGDAIVFKLNPAGSALIYSTYVGGTESEQGYGITVDGSGNALVTGQTTSSNSPVTVGAYDTSYNGGGPWGGGDIFVMMLNPAGSAQVYSTFVGGTDDDIGYSVCMDPMGAVYVTGKTLSTDLPVTGDAYQSSNGGDNDVILVVLDSSCSSLTYMTYFGGLGADVGKSIMLDSMGSMLVAGETASSGFPTTQGAYDTTYNSNVDAFAMNLTFKTVMEVISVSMLRNGVPDSEVYTRRCPYTLMVNVTDTLSLNDVEDVLVQINPPDADVHLSWNRSTGEFTKVQDVLDAVTIEPTSSASDNGWNRWTIRFNLTFEWHFPPADACDVNVRATSRFLADAWRNASDLCSVNNKVTFKDDVLVSGEDGRSVEEFDWVREGEELTWHAPVVIYEGSDDAYPPDAEYDVVVWDHTMTPRTDSPGPGQKSHIPAVVAPAIGPGAHKYTVNLTGIPPYCDRTNVEYHLFIDGLNVTYSDASPDNVTWHTDPGVDVGVRITDNDGSGVNASTIMYSTSADNGTTWGPWESSDQGTGIAVEVFALDRVNMEDGTDNMLRWSAEDAVGNGPAVSAPQRVLVDSTEVTFTGPEPFPTNTSMFSTVRVGVTISDELSGVDASSVEYSYSTDGGGAWSNWLGAAGTEDGPSIPPMQNITFPEGDQNRVRWRAKDIAGNGPTMSPEYVVKVDTTLAGEAPRVALLAPADGSVTTTGAVDLSWELESDVGSAVTYELLLDTVNPPVTAAPGTPVGTALHVDALTDKTTYYWTVIPSTSTMTGICVSGVWSFTYDKDALVPEVRLVSPADGAVITAPEVELVWEPVAGGDGWRYDVYLGKDDPPAGMNATGITDRRLSLAGLEEGSTYHWTVTPISEQGVYGVYASTVWSFTVSVPTNELEWGVILGAVQDIYMKAGETAEILVNITNTGIAVDRFFLVPHPGGLQDTATLERPSQVSLDPAEASHFTLRIILTKDAPTGSFQFTITANSLSAQALGHAVLDNVTFMVHVTPADKSSGSTGDASGRLTTVGLLLLAIIVAIVIATALLVYRKRKKRREAEEEERAKAAGEVLEADMVGPSAVGVSGGAGPAVIDVVAGAKGPDQTLGGVGAPAGGSAGGAGLPVSGAAVAPAEQLVVGAGEITAPDRLLPSGGAHDAAAAAPQAVTPQAQPMAPLPPTDVATTAQPMATTPMAKPVVATPRAPSAEPPMADPVDGA